MLNYSDYREALQWTTDGDPLYRDGTDHYQVDRRRFERAVKTMGSLDGSTVYDLGSFPGYGVWAFRECKHYVGLGKCPVWYRETLLNKFHADFYECDFENASTLPVLPYKPDIVTFQELLEHIRQPKAFLTTLHTWMPVGTEIYLTTNNIHYIGYILKLLARKEIFHPAMLEGTVYPGHCTYYSLDGLTHLLTDIGFTVVSADYVNFLPQSRFYRNRVFGFVKNLLVKSVPVKYGTHLEILCQKH